MMKVEEESIENILKKVALSKNFKNYEVFSDNKPILGEGFLSEFFFGAVLNKDNDKITQVAIKKASLDGFSASVGHEEIYKHEIYFYSEVFPKLDKFQKEKKVNCPFKHIPRFFAGSVESKNIFIAMENLKTAGYVPFDKNRLFDRDHLEFIFKAYGKFHALSVVFKQTNAEGYTNLVKNFVTQADTIADEIVTMMGKGFSIAIETFDPIIEADILGKLKSVDVKKTVKKVQTYKGPYKCLIHGDCWSNNMLFKYKEYGELEDIKLVDFQASSSNSPIHDLSYFFYSGASKKDMDKLDYYLEVYYQSFSNFARELGGNSEDIFSLETLKEEWKQYGVWGIFLGCQVWLIKLMDREEIENVLQQKRLTQAKYMELWNEKMDKVGEGKVYRERVRDICLHAVEYGII